MSDDNDEIIRPYNHRADDGQPVRGYVIYCPVTHCWRTREPIDGPDAWTRSGDRAIYETHGEAQAELDAVWARRRAQDVGS